MILEIGGTSDSIAIALRLEKEGFPLLLSFTTDYGKTLAEESGVQQVLLGKLDQEGMTRVILDQQVDCLIDASHPFAQEASKTAMAVTEACGINYIRFERPEEEEEGAIYVDSIAEACREAQKCLKSKPGSKVYLTVGSRTLSQYLDQLPREALLARVLPRTESMEVCEELGLELGQVEGLMGPFSTETNLALIRENQACCLISKDSGQRGGLAQKVEACRQAEIPCIIIRRPQLPYPNKVSSIENLLVWLKKNENC